MNDPEKIARQKFSLLSPEAQAEVLAFIDFLLNQQIPEKCVPNQGEWLQWGAGLHQEVWHGIDSTAFLQQLRDN